MIMTVIGWIVLGLIAGFLASMVVKKRGEGPVHDIVLGMIGAVVGGWLFRTLGSDGATGFNFWSLLVAFVGAVAVLFAWYAIRGRGPIVRT